MSKRPEVRHMRSRAKLGPLPYGRGSVRDILSRMSASVQYIMGHDDRERRRLALQGTILNPLTEQLLRRAGISSGMQVLDLGCGVGEVSLMAARLAGRHGHVTSIDLDPAALETAGKRAWEQGITNVSFVQSSIDQFQPERTFDAVVGRHILIHVKDPLAVLRKASECLSESGVAVFQEYDFATIQETYPRCPLAERLRVCFRDFFCTVTHGNIGTRLLHLFLEAGFHAPDCRAEYPIDGGPESPFYEWMAESFRSMMPRAVTAGFLKENDFNVDTLASELLEEAVSRNACVPGPTMVGAFARKR